jgi:hypothetical protein
MADINLSPYTADQQAMNRRRRMAEAMQQQSITPIEMPTMPGVAISPYAGLAKLFQGYIAGKNFERADQEQKSYETSSQEDVARLLRNMGKTETIPGDIITPGIEAIYEPSVPIQENLDRKQELVNLIAPDPTNAARAAIGYNLMRPEDRERITNLPGETEGREIPAVAEVRGASRQVPYLSADLLDPNNPNAMKTGQGKQMLAQYLMQQEAQKQATALRKQEAEQAIVKFSPEDTAGRIVDGKFVPIVTGKPKIEYTKVETRDSVTGQPIIKYVDKTKLGELGNILAPYTGMVADLMQAQDLPAAIKNNPDALRLIGGYLGKQGGDVTAADFAKVMISLDETNARLRNEGIDPVSTNIVKPKNIMITSVDLPPKGSPLENGKVYNTPRGQARWDGTKFVTID